ncbi:hypothetical protein BASP5262_11315 [Bacillus spizizenii]|nr:hypothetical protein DJ97_1957 [Bacillus spizizenii]SPU06828.1 Uncharacterised protein [Bacillus spizizenii]
MNVSAFKVTILYMFVHVNDIFPKIYICTYVFKNIKTPNFSSPGFSLRVYI